MTTNRTCGRAAAIAILVSSLVPALAVRPSSGCGRPAPAPPGQTEVLGLPFEGLDRSYRLHLPTGYDAGQPTPLVLSFHGYTSSASLNELGTTGLSPHADANGYVVVYPEGTRFGGFFGVSSWNDGSCNASPGPAGPICAPDAFVYPNPPECGPRSDDCNWCTCYDDLGFVSELLDQLESTVCVDLDRIYATGMSNGGMFAHRLGCEMSDRFAAVAPVAGQRAIGFDCAAPASSPVALMHVGGVEDTTVPFDGATSSDGYFYLAVPTVLDFWAEAQSCSPQRSRYPTSGDGVRGFRCRQHVDCATGVELVGCAWRAGHVWPDAPESPGFGNDVLWSFFERNPKRTPEP